MKRREEERRKEAREKEGCVFCASPLSPFLSLSFSSKSHPRLNFGFASKSLRERCLAASSRRFDPTFLSPWLDGSAGEEERGRVTLARSQPLVHPRKSCGGLDLSSLERADASATILSDLLPVLSYRDSRGIP